MLAVLSSERSAAFPDVPTMKELGYPDLVVDTWYGVFAPAGTPRAVIERLNFEINALVASPPVEAALERQGLTAVYDKPERLGTLVNAELARWKRVVAQGHIQGD
jgi:tripartite-type tricarboxylate transporter receptor subunit TctC